MIVMICGCFIGLTTLHHKYRGRPYSNASSCWKIEPLSGSEDLASFDAKPTCRSRRSEPPPVEQLSIWVSSSVILL